MWKMYVIAHIVDLICLKSQLFRQSQYAILCRANIRTSDIAISVTWVLKHYSDVIMSAMASQIIDVSIICSIVGSGADQRNIRLRVTGLCAGKSPVTEIECRIYVSVKLAIIGSEIDLSPGPHKAIIWANADLLSIDTKDQCSEKN